MIVEMCKQAAAVTLGVDESKDWTELVRGQDTRLIDEYAPLVRRQSVTLDLHSVTRIDAAGIAALVSLYRCALEAGNRFTVSNATPRVAEILALVGLDRILLSEDADQPPILEHCLEQPAA